jgi:cell pole-organizing protein PopZ
MAPASSAQREPSMEEILASIRRIIEDSDAAQKRPDEPAAHFPANEPLTTAKAEVEAFRAELRPVPEVAAERRPTPAPVAAPPQMTELPPKAFRLAEVQAQVAREVAAQSKVSEPERRPVSLADVQQQLAKETAVFAPPPPLSNAPAAAPPKLDNSTIPTAEAKPEKAREPVAYDLRRDEPLPKTGAVPAPVAEAAPKPAIISPSAGRQVAAAFGELSEAFAARSKKTFDDLAEQMLRPMLQDWLDNNLPILVERLVREEIERVARGVE